MSFVNNLNYTYNTLHSNGDALKSIEDLNNYTLNIYQSLKILILNLNKTGVLNINETQLEIPTNYFNLVGAIRNKEYQKAIPLLIIEFGPYLNCTNASTRTLTFIAQLATLQTGSDMEALLNAYALPIGSASIKRNSTFNLSVNAYVGMTGGRETAYGTMGNPTRGNIGLATPIGVSVTFCKGYLTAFISGIDLGAIVNQRINNDTTSYTNIKFEHFFSPGLSLFFNIPKLPITAGIQWSYIQNLRALKFTNGAAQFVETNRDVSRIYFSVLVDIPVFTLYNMDKRR